MRLTRRGLLAALAGGGAALLAGSTMQSAGVALPDPSGIDDTAALNAALAANAGTSVQGVPGAAYRISAPLVVHSGTTLDLTSCTITLLPGSDCRMVVNAAVIGGRDTDVTIIGGTWDRGGNMGVGNDRHSLFFRRVDRLTVRDLRVVSTSGKYALAIGDAADVRVRDLSFDTASDGVHITGPARGVDVRGLTGRTGDDMMALTGRDWTAYDDVRGDIEGVTVDGVYPNGSLAALKIISGTGTAVRGVTIRGIYGTTTIRPIAIMDDTTGPTTVSGLTIADVDVQAGPDQSLVWLRCSDARDITVRDVRVRRPITTTYTPVFLIDRDATRIESLTIDGLSVDTPLAGPNLVLVTSAAVVGALTLSRVRAVDLTSDGVSVGGNATVRRLLVEDYHSSGSGKSVVQVGGSAEHVTLSAVRVVGQNGVRVHNTALPGLVVRLADVDLDGGGSGGYAVDTYCPTQVDFAGGDMTVSAAICRASGPSASLDIRGWTRNSRGKPGVIRDGSQPITVRSLDYECDVSLLTRVAGSMAYNTNGSLSCGVGPVTCDGTIWRSVASGATY